MEKKIEVEEATGEESGDSKAHCSCGPPPPIVPIRYANDFVVKSAPPTIYYVRNFITEEDESYYMSMVYAAPKPKWQCLLNRRLQNYGGVVGKKSLIRCNDIPMWLEDAIDKVQAVKGGFPPENRPNHVLVNEYKPGQGIMAHTDGPAFFPLVSTISLGSDVLIDYYLPLNSEQSNSSKAERYVGSLFVERRSLLLVTEQAYSDHLHEIDDRMEDVITDKVFNLKDTELSIGEVIPRKLRVSLTIRNVPKLSKLSVSDFLKR